MLEIFLGRSSPVPCQLWQVCASAGQHSAVMVFQRVVCINRSPATKFQTRQSKSDPWLCSAAETCLLPRHGSVHHAHKCFIPHLLNENNHTSFVKQFMLLTNTLYCFDLAARGVTPADPCLFRLQDFGQRPPLFWRDDTEKMLNHLYPPDKPVLLQPQFFSMLLWCCSCYSQKKNGNAFAKNPTQVLGLIQNSVNPNPLIVGKGQENTLVRKILSQSVLD